MNEPQPTVDTLPEIRAYHVRIGSGHIHCVHGRSPEHAIVMRLRDGDTPIHALVDLTKLRAVVWDDGPLDGPCASGPDDEPVAVFGPVGTPRIYEMRVDFVQLSPAD